MIERQRFGRNTSSPKGLRKPEMPGRPSSRRLRTSGGASRPAVPRTLGPKGPRRCLRFRDGLQGGAVGPSSALSPPGATATGTPRREQAGRGRSGGARHGSGRGGWAEMTAEAREGAPDLLPDKAGRLPPVARLAPEPPHHGRRSDVRGRPHALDGRRRRPPGRTAGGLVPRARRRSPPLPPRPVLQLRLSAWLSGSSTSPL